MLSSPTRRATVFAAALRDKAASASHCSQKEGSQPLLRACNRNQFSWVGSAEPVATPTGYPHVNSCDVYHHILPTF